MYASQPKMHMSTVDNFQIQLYYDNVINFGEYGA